MIVENKSIINRTEEIRLITTRLDNLMNKVPVPDPVLFFYGVPYVGKTTILNHIFKIASDRGLPVALLDFDREQIKNEVTLSNRYDSESGFANLVSDLFFLLNDFNNANSIVTPKLVMDDLYNINIANEFVSFVRQKQERLGRPIVFLFDTLEDISPETFLLLQERILAPLLMNSHIFVAMAGWTDYQESQQSLIWSVSRFTKVHQLRPFDAQWTEKHLKKLNAEIAQLSGKNILALTGGIPGLNEKLVSQQKVIFDEVGIVTYLVNQVIFPRFASRGLEEVRKELVAVAPFRQFDTRLFQHLLEQLWPKIYQDMSLGQARNTLRKLRRTSLMQQAQDTYGYVIPHDIRRVIENYLFLSQPELYIEINFLAILWFRQEISEGEYPMIVNEIYHLASVWRYLDVHGLTMIGENFSNLKDEFKSQINCIEHLNQRLVSVLEPLRINPRTPDWVEKIMRALKATEFRWLLKEEDIEKLLQVCKTYLREEFDDHDVR